MSKKVDRNIASVVRKIRISERTNDAEYWRSLTAQERIDALEQIREEYHRWLGDVESGFQRVYTIVKR